MFKRKIRWGVGPLGLVITGVKLSQILDFGASDGGNRLNPVGFLCRRLIKAVHTVLVTCVGCMPSMLE